ncbi:MAG: tetratricopeptide repeat protein [Candidatus Aquilonibacter sp.]
MHATTAMALEQARRFLELGQLQQAKEAYLAVLLRDRYHREGMLGLADVFVASEDFASARIVLARAVERYPDSPVLQSALGGVLLEVNDPSGARDAFAAALRVDPQHRKAWCGLGVVFERAGDVERADAAWREAFRNGGPAISAYRGQGEPARVLLLWSAVDGNVPVNPILDDRVVQWATLFVESFETKMALPPHDVVFNAVGNADLSTRALDKAEQIVNATSAPVINHPAHVRRTGRVAVAEQLRDAPGVVTPRIARMPRAELLAASNLTFPMLVRAPGFHTGEHFVRIDSATRMCEGIADLPGDELLAMEYLDTRGSDEVFRKYRVLMVDGKLYPVHLAASRNWKVHYFSADCQAAHLPEEQAFLADMEAALGGDALRALEQAANLLALDYGGIDFAINGAGRVVIFEANPTMRVPKIATGAIEAARRMIRQRMRRKIG